MTADMKLVVDPRAAVAAFVLLEHGTDLDSELAIRDLSLALVTFAPRVVAAGAHEQHLA